MVQDGTLYSPSNSDEGFWFMSNFCDRCVHQNPDPDPKYTKAKNCEIFGKTLAYQIMEPDYPKEWCYKNGKPVCTAWKKWDWTHDGDPYDPNNPYKLPDPPDPNQLSLFPHINVAERLTGLK